MEHRKAQTAKALINAKEKTTEAARQSRVNVLHVHRALAERVKENSKEKEDKKEKRKGRRARQKAISDANYRSERDGLDLLENSNGSELPPPRKGSKVRRRVSSAERNRISHLRNGSGTAKKKKITAFFSSRRTST